MSVFIVLSECMVSYFTGHYYALTRTKFIQRSVKKRSPFQCSITSVCVSFDHHGQVEASLYIFQDISTSFTFGCRYFWHYYIFVRHGKNLPYCRNTIEKSSRTTLFESASGIHGMVGWFFGKFHIKPCSHALSIFHFEFSF